MEIIHLNKVSKAFGKNNAVSDVNFTVEKGWIIGSKRSGKNLNYTDD